MSYYEVAKEVTVGLTYSPPPLANVIGRKGFDLPVPRPEVARHQRKARFLVAAGHPVGWTLLLTVENEESAQFPFAGGFVQITRSSLGTLASAASAASTLSNRHATANLPDAAKTMAVARFVL